MANQTRPTNRPAARRGVRWSRLIPVVLILAGALVSVWPIGQTYWNNYQGSLAAQGYGQAVASVAPSALTNELKAATRYNDALTPGVLADPWDDATPASSPAHDVYLTQLSQAGPLGRIRIPTIAVDLPIQHDATHASLALGAGHMYGTSLPVGGVGTHAVIAAHTGSHVRTFFDRLPELSGGDLIFLDVAGQTLTYRVETSYVVMPDDLSKIAPVAGRDLITLVTCRLGSDGINRRLLVRAGRIPTPPGAGFTASETALPAGPGATAQPPATASKTSPTGTQAQRHAATFDLSLQGWMIPRLALAGGALFVVLMMSLGWWQGDRRERLEQHGSSQTNSQGES